MLGNFCQNSSTGRDFFAVIPLHKKLLQLLITWENKKRKTRRRKHSWRFPPEGGKKNNKIMTKKLVLLRGHCVLIGRLGWPWITKMAAPSCSQAWEDLVYNYLEEPMYGNAPVRFRPSPKNYVFRHSLFAHLGPLISAPRRLENKRGLLLIGPSFTSSM